MKFEQKYRIEYADCDLTGKLKLSTMVDLSMKVSNEQLVNSSLSTQSMLKQNLGWVVTQYEFEIESLPQVEQEVILQTEASGYNRLLEYRNFAILNQQHEVLVKVRSQWVMLDLLTRKIVPAPKQLMAEFAAPLLKHLPKFVRLRAKAADQYQQVKEYQVRFYDIDTNQHFTNSHYFDWLMDAMGYDFLKQYVPSRIDISYVKELAYQDLAQVKTFVSKQSAAVKSYHLLKKGDVTTTICEIEWKLNSKDKE